MTILRHSRLLCNQETISVGFLHAQHVRCGLRRHQQRLSAGPEKLDGLGKQLCHGRLDHRVCKALFTAESSPETLQQPGVSCEQVNSSPIGDHHLTLSAVSVFTRLVIHLGTTNGHTVSIIQFAIL